VKKSMDKVVQAPVAMPNVEADVTMTVSPPSRTVSVRVEALCNKYELCFELYLLDQGIKWRDNLEQVPKALELYCNEEITKIERVRF
jgi:hypothetical protein